MRVAEAPKEKKPKKEAGGANEGAAGTSKAGAQGAAAEGKKEKAEKPKKEKAAPAPAAPVQPPSPHMIDLRVGKIVKVDKHPDADSLWVFLVVGFRSLAHDNTPGTSSRSISARKPEPLYLDWSSMCLLKKCKTR